MNGHITGQSYSRTSSLFRRSKNNDSAIVFILHHLEASNRIFYRQLALSSPSSEKMYLKNMSIEVSIKISKSVGNF